MILLSGLHNTHKHTRPLLLQAVLLLGLQCLSSCWLNGLCAIHDSNTLLSLQLDWLHCLSVRPLKFRQRQRTTHPASFSCFADADMWLLHAYRYTNTYLLWLCHFVHLFVTLFPHFMTPTVQQQVLKGYFLQYLIGVIMVNLTLGDISKIPGFILNPYILNTQSVKPTGELEVCTLS